jgi:uncharacterized membrane protein YccC
MRFLNLEHRLFSLKTFCAGALALLISFWLDLPKPYWALATVYIASQPLSGATRSKATFRAIGTILGAVVAVALTPNLVNAPALLVLAISLWTGFCLYLAIRDRSPRGYTFLLAGYTTGIIAFPAVDAPETVFDLALARSEEILVGILCAAIVSSVVFPRSVGPVVAERLEAWLDDARASSLDALRGATDAGEEKRWLKLAADIAEFENLASHLVYEAGTDPHAISYVQQAVPRMLMLLPVLSSISDRLSEIAKTDEASPQIETLVARISAWLEGGDAGEDEKAQALRADIETQGREFFVDAPWRRLLEAGLILRLRDLVDLHDDCAKLLAALADGSPAGTLAVPIEALVERARHRDLGAGLIAALAPIVAIALCCAVWILSAWPEGAAAATMTAVTAGLFGAQDDPTPAVKGFAKWAFFGTVIAGLYVFLILPRIHGMETLTLVLAPTFLLIGLLMAAPATFMIGLPLSLIIATTMALQQHFSVDAETFINASSATVAGVGFTALTTALIRLAGAEWRALRFVKANRLALAEAADVHTPNDEARVLGLMFDRLALLAPISHALDQSMPDAMRELRAGFNILEAHAARGRLSPTARRAVDALLMRLARHYRRRPGGSQEGIAAAIEKAARAVGSGGDAKALLALSGLSRALFPQAPPPDFAPSTGLSQ